MFDDDIFYSDDFNFTKEELEQQAKANKEYEQYKQDLINNGYEDGDGKKLKCKFCDCKELECKNEIFEGGIGTVEFDYYCTKCGKKIGSWAYGCWFD